MADTNLSSDIYGVNDYVNEVKKEFITDVNEDTLMLGTFGYFGQIMSDMFQNTIVMASEFSNESIATKAKFEKNIIAHALGLGITDINAVPAHMDVYLVFLEKDIETWANARTANDEELPWTFVFDKDNSIYFGDYEFHPDYDIVIKKVEVITQGMKTRFAYTAQYKQDDFDTTNPVSDITNPYLTPPVKMNIQGVDTLLVKCTIRQVEKATQSTRVLSDDDISAKTITFTFEGQLAAFSLDVTEGSDSYHMIPVYEGLNVDTGGNLYFWYTYLDTNTIRIKFDRNSRIPAVNAEVNINIQTTQGSSGNFTFYKDETTAATNYPSFTFESDRLNYSNIVCQVRPVDGSAVDGRDKMTIEELKQIIPKEALSRGSITNLTDLNNHFNSLITDYSKLYFYKKRDNCLERLYYSFMIAKNDLNIIPTNTINLIVSPDDMVSEDDSDVLILKQGTCIILTPGESEARILKEGEVLPEEDGSTYDGSFAYYLPYDFAISKSPLYGMYFITTIHATKILDFKYINESCMYQYIATKIDWDRNCLENHNTYTLTFNVSQNITPSDEDAGDAPIRYETPMIEKEVEYIAGYDEDGNPLMGKTTVQEEGEAVLVCDVEAYIIIYDEEGVPLRWAKANKECNPDLNSIAFTFQFTSEDFIDNENRIRIDTGLFDINSENESYAHLTANTSARLFVVSKQGNNYGLGEPALSDYIPGLDSGEWSLSNTYVIMNGLDFFYDYSSIISSTVTVTNDLVDEEGNIIYPTEKDDSEEDTEEEEKEDIILEDLGVVLSYMSPGHLVLYDTSYNQIGPSLEIPMDTMIVDFEQDVENRTVKLFFDKEKTRYIEVNVDELTYEEPPKVPHYHITGVPAVKYGYFDTEDTAKQFFNELVTRKAYINDAVMKLEDAFEMDFKFFNTYGPSKFFTWDNGTDVIDRINISLFFKLKLKPNYSSNIVEEIRADVKDYVEDINEIKDLHIPNLITYITNKYEESIVYFEFVSINGKEASYQHIYAMDVPDGIMVPEFININTLADGTPDITIELA